MGLVVAIPSMMFYNPFIKKNRGFDSQDGRWKKGTKVRVKKFDSINVVPFIDIMLVLLVIVLTTSTFIAKGIIPVDLSEAKHLNQ